MPRPQNTPSKASASPVVFPGRECDAETGYSYFGYSYMFHELMTMWLPVDPMADKYPAILLNEEKVIDIAPGFFAITSWARSMGRVNGKNECYAL